MAKIKYLEVKLQNFWAEQGADMASDIFYLLSTSDGFYALWSMHVQELCYPRRRDVRMLE